MTTPEKMLRDCADATLRHLDGTATEDVIRTKATAMIQTGQLVLDELDAGRFDDDLAKAIRDNADAAMMALQPPAPAEFPDCGGEVKPSRRSAATAWARDVAEAEAFLTSIWP